MKAATERIYIDTNNPYEYGAISLTAMANKNLSIESKAIYAYICARAGRGNSAFPSIDTMCMELNISRQRFLKHRKPLLDCGLLIIEHPEREGNRNASNVYKLPMHRTASFENNANSDPLFLVGEHQFDAPPSSLNKGDFDRSQNVTGQKFDRSQNVTGENPDRSQNVTGENRESGIKPPCSDRSRFDTGQNTTCNGWLDGLSTTTNTTNQPTDTTSMGDVCDCVSSAEVVSETFNELCKSSVNRNRLRNASGIASTREAYSNLLERFTPSEIKDAWLHTLRACENKGLEDRYYPQLCRWLTDDAETVITKNKHAKACKARNRKTDDDSDIRLRIKEQLIDSDENIRKLSLRSKELREQLMNLPTSKRFTDAGKAILEEHHRVIQEIEDAIDKAGTQYAQGGSDE